MDLAVTQCSGTAAALFFDDGLQFRPQIRVNCDPQSESVSVRRRIIIFASTNLLHTSHLVLLLLSAIISICITMGHRSFADELLLLSQK